MCEKPLTIKEKTSDSIKMFHYSLFNYIINALAHIIDNDDNTAVEIWRFDYAAHK